MRTINEIFESTLKHVSAGEWSSAYTELKVGMEVHPIATIEFMLFGEPKIPKNRKRFIGRIPWNGKFWKSGLPFEYLDDLFLSKYANEFYAALFLHEKSFTIPREIISMLGESQPVQLANAIRDTDAVTSKKYLKVFINEWTVFYALMNHCPEALMRGIRSTQVFLEDNLIKKLEALKYHQNSAFPDFYHKIIVIKDLADDYEHGEEAKTCRDLLRKYSFEEILIESTAYLEMIKRWDIRCAQNRNHTIIMEMNLAYSINILLKDKRSINNSEECVPPKPMPAESFKSNLKNALPRHITVDEIDRSINPKGNIEKNYNRKEELRRVFKFYFNKHAFKFHISKFRNGYGDAVWLGGKIYIRQNENFSWYWRNDKKSTYFETFILNKTFDLPSSKLEIKKEGYSLLKYAKLSGLADIEYFSFNEFPIQLSYTNQKSVNLERVFILLRGFSELMMPSRRTYTQLSPNSISDFRKGLPEGLSIVKGNDGYYLKDEPTKPLKFQKAFKDDFLVRFTKNSLQNGIKTLFGWSLKEIESIIDFLTLDLNAEDQGEINIHHRPLLKVGYYYYWMSAFNRDRAWANLIHRRILTEKIIKHPKEIADRLEAKIAHYFVAAGFQAGHSFDYELADGGKSDIDILAYKDGILFLAELKTTYVTDDLTTISNHRRRTYEMKALSQLKKAERFLSEKLGNPGELKAFLAQNGIQLDIPPQELRIFPIIISNTFSVDDLMLDEKYLKISILELVVLLKNNLEELMVTNVGKMIHESLPGINVNDFKNKHNQRAMDYKHKSWAAYNYDLWEGKNEITGTMLAKGLGDGRVWAFLDELQDFEAQVGLAIELEAYVYDIDQEFPI